MIVAGCAQCPPFRTAWYLDKPQEPTPTMLLALLNEGTRTLRINRLVLNPTGAGGSEVIPGVKVPAGGLEPGRLVVLDVGDALAKCHLPVAVELDCGVGRPRTQAVSGLLPNYLHDKWTDGTCGRLDPPAPGTPAVAR